MTELELVRLIRKGDRKAFDILCREYYAAFISYARRTARKMSSKMSC